MVGVKNEGIVLEPLYDFEKRGVLNPTCLEVGDEIWMYYRAVDENNVSSIGFCKLKDNEVIERHQKPIMKPEFDYEKMGIEDPRITQIGKTYYMFYTVYDGKNAQVAYATTTKLPYFEKRGLLMPKISYKEAGEILKASDLSLRYKYFEERYKESRGEDILLWEKDVVLFPEKINGKFAILHRILPGIQVAYFDKFSQLDGKYWRHHFANLDDHQVIEPSLWYESRNVGGGCPPVRIKEGWLIIYHSVEKSTLGKIYHASAALLDLNDPTIVLSRLNNPLFSPIYSYEKIGIVNNVVFPTAAIAKDNRLYIYHGSGDFLIALKSVNLNDLITELRENAKSAQGADKPSPSDHIYQVS